MSDLKGLSRRKFLALTGATAAHAALYAAPTPPAPPRAGALSLAGEWRFALDRDDRGLKEEWFSQELSGRDMISLPGILQTQGYGDEIAVDTPWVAALPRDMRWYQLPQYAPYTKPGHVEMPYLAQPVKHYLGAAWYQRSIEVPKGWGGKRLALTLERTRWRTTVFLDGKQIGECHSLVAPHEFDLGLVASGTHRLTIRIDNSMILPYRPDGHSVSDHEGGTWNGIVGRIELAATSLVWIDDAQVYPNVAEKRARVKVRIGNATGKPGTGTIAIGAKTAAASWDENGGQAELDVALPGATPWSEFTPVLQHLTVRLSGAGAADQRQVTFGLREIKADGRHILLNGELFNFRATHDGGGFPLTGYPATDVATWKRIVSTCKQWGLNGIRFHSWCPPEAAFIAGDELGFYFQPECGMWNSFDVEGKMLAVLNDETERLLKAYGNHPSLVMLNASNEPAGHYQEQLPTWDKKWRAADSRRLYSDGTGRWAPPPGGPGTPFAADFLVTGGARGPRGWFGADYEETLDQILRGSFGRPGAQGAGKTPPIVPTPCIGHEVGQWCAYPDFDVIAKFSQPAGRPNFPAGKGAGRTPYMVPGDYHIWRDFAEKNHVLARNKAMAAASGRFQLACYKEEIEANMRTPGYSGIELLDLHDYLGQGGALIGLLDAFWESKGYVQPAEFREFCGPTVPLARLRDRVLTTDHTLDVPVEGAHYGPTALRAVRTQWRIADDKGRAVASGEFPSQALERGKNIPLGKINAPLNALTAPANYRLVVEMHAGAETFRNEWNFWLYSAAAKADASGDVLVTTSWTDAEGKLAAGGRVLYLPPNSVLGAESPRVTTVPTFWNFVMNGSGSRFLGLLVDEKHPALAGYPTSSHCDWQWVDMFRETRALDLTGFAPDFFPIVQSIDDWNRSLKLALLYECKVGPGKLMVSTLDLGMEQGAEGAATQVRPGSVALRNSVLKYMASAEFQPRTTIAAEMLRACYQNPHAAPATPAQPAQPNSPDLVDPGQIRRRPGA